MSRFMIQFINGDNGQRTEPFVATMDQLREVLQDVDDPKMQKDYCLMVGMIEDEELKVINAPLLSVKSLQEMFQFQDTRAAGNE